MAWCHEIYCVVSKNLLFGEILRNVTHSVVRHIERAPTEREGRVGVFELLHDLLVEHIQLVLGFLVHLLGIACLVRQVPGVDGGLLALVWDYHVVGLDVDRCEYVNTRIVFPFNIQGRINQCRWY